MAATSHHSIVQLGLARRQSIFKYHLASPLLAPHKHTTAGLGRLKITGDDDDGEMRRWGEMVDKYLINLIRLPCLSLESAIL